MTSFSLENLSLDSCLSRREFIKSSTSAAVAATLGLTGCLGRGNIQKIGVGYQPNYFQALSGILAASKVDKLGGINLSYDGFLSGSSMISSMVAQGNLVGYMGDMPGLLAADENKMSGGGYIVAKDNCAPGSTLSIVTREGEFDSIEELDREDVDFKVNHFSYAHRWVLHLMEKEGFENLSLEDLFDGSPTIFTSQLRKGSIDAFANWEPSPSNALYISKHREGIDPEILTTGANYPEFVGMSLVVMHPELVTGKHRDLGVRWLKNHLDLRGLIKNQRKETINLLANQPTLSYPREVAERSFSKMEMGDFDSGFGEREKAELRDAVSFLKNPPGELTSIMSKEFELEKKLDTSLLKEARKQ